MPFSISKISYCDDNPMEARGYFAQQQQHEKDPHVQIVLASHLRPTQDKTVYQDFKTIFSHQGYLASGCLQFALPDVPRKMIHRGQRLVLKLLQGSIQCMSQLLEINPILTSLFFSKRASILVLVICMLS